MSLPRRVEVLAPAKINPLLDVLGRREDGYHELDTTLLALELADHLLLEVDPDGTPGAVTLELAGPFASADVPRDDRNLAVRAARAALALAGDSAPRALRITLTKDVPSQAGLGGGSSDAAAALAGVEVLAGVDLGAVPRRALLAQLGSDCVFFDAARSTGAARATGRGERVEVLPAPVGDEGEWWVALLTPAEGCSTTEVYAALDWPLSPPPAVPTVPSLLGMRASEARASLRNQLEAAALAVSPGLEGWRDALDAAGADHFRLAGSGSSFFGLYDSANEATEGMLRVLDEVRRRALALRGRWVTRTCGHGSKPV